jgi:hypothetical protein
VFGDSGPLEVEAVEEPSSIAGHPISETSYVGLEPWIVLMRNREAQVRYVVAVTPDGTIAGAFDLPFQPHEDTYLLPSRFTEIEE